MSSFASHLRFIVNQDGAVILDIPRNQMVTLNATGGYIWDKLQRGKAVEEIVRELSMETNTDPHIVERDVDAFLEQLMSKHLLHD
ncbi:PqqD family protein [Tunturiibacter gelidiferens]|uniref:PqqD family protein n=1 Tax=Tunturiibacter gelidiferens TaxID=3069689 RepID=A0AAU7YZH6_9BACT